MRSNPEQTKEFMFAAIVATTTGRMAAFYHWSNMRRVLEPDSCKELKEKSIFFPKVSETEVFIEFLKDICQDKKWGVSSVDNLGIVFHLVLKAWTDTVNF